MITTSKCGCSDYAGRVIDTGVLLDQGLDDEPGGIGAWLADAAAFDAGGADALWIDPGPESRLDVLALTAALAAVTSRARLVVAPGRRTGGLDRTIDTIRRLSHGRLALIADPGEFDELAPVMHGVDAMHGVDTMHGVDAVEVFRRVSGEPGAFEGTRAGRWVSTPVPQSRAAWWAARADAAERGARGLVVPADPRLLDILRNPDEPGERRDLQLSQG
jgi:hypothetical protein